MRKKLTPKLTPLQTLKQSQKPKRKTLPQLTKEADKWFSKYIRLRDAEFKHGQWIGECITCSKKLVVVTSEGRWKSNTQNGHYIGRSRKNTRWDELNCNLQCARCNAWMDKFEMLRRYERALKLKYGDEIPLVLQEMGKVDYKPTRSDLEEKIEEDKAWVEWTLAHPKGL